MKTFFSSVNEENLGFSLRTSRHIDNKESLYTLFATSTPILFFVLLLSPCEMWWTWWCVGFDGDGGLGKQHVD